MAITNASTTAGLQFTELQGLVTARFRLTSTLFDAVVQVETSSAQSVQFNTELVPAAAGSHTEGADLTALAQTISAVSADLVEYAELSRVSHRAERGWEGQIPTAVVNRLAGGMARKIDTLIGALVGAFTTTQNAASGVALTLDNMLDASAALDATGFIGEKVAVLHPQAYNEIAKDLTGLVGGSGGEGAAIRGTGFLGRMYGIEWFVSPWVTVASDVSANGIYFKHALGFGFRAPLIEVKSGDFIQASSTDYLVRTLGVAKEITDGAGITVYHDTTA